MKLLVFLPMIIFFAFFLILVIGIFILIFKLIKNGRESAWTGTLVDKKYFEKDREDSRLKDNFYTLIFETDEKKIVKVGVSKEIYATYKTGDRAEKVKGELYIKKLA